MGVIAVVLIHINQSSTHIPLSDIIYKQCHDAVDKENCIAGWKSLYLLNPDKFMRDWDR